MSAESEKRLAGEAAAALIEPGMTVGLGTGSTAAYFVKALGGRAKGLDLRCVSTSEATEALARQVGLRTVRLDEAREIDLTVDGADEIGPALGLIKGGGGALLREKLVWEASRRCVVIADSAKSVRRLGAFPLPVETAAFGHETTARRIKAVLTDLALEPVVTLRRRGGASFVTDGGGVIYDLQLGEIPAPSALAAGLKAVTGVVEHGLFLGLADEALIGTPNGVERRLADGAPASP